MRFNVAQLIKGPTGSARKYELNEEIRRLDPALDPQSPLQGRVTFMRTSQGILVTGTVRVTLRLECRRCLEPYDEKVRLRLEEEYLPVVRIDNAPVDVVPDEDQDLALLIDADHMLDLSEVVRQGLLLASATPGLCRTDCLGLCPQCGGNRNLGECECDATAIDPRWAALQSLFPDAADSQERSN